MTTMMDFLGKEYSDDHRILSVGDQLTHEWQMGAQ